MLLNHCPTSVPNMKSRAIRAAVNQVSHALAAAEYDRIRAALMAEAKAMMAAGATEVEVLATLDSRCVRAGVRARGVEWMTPC